MEFLNGKTTQWVGRQAMDNGQHLLLVANVESRTPNFVQILGVRSGDGVRTISTGSAFEENGRVKGKTDNYHFFDTTAGTFIPLAEQFRRSGSKDKPPTSATRTGTAHKRKSIPIASSQRSNSSREASDGREAS